MSKERTLTLDVLRLMNAMDRRGSFATAADELVRVPSALSYTMQKLEEELDVVLIVLDIEHVLLMLVVCC